MRTPLAIALLAAGCTSSPMTGDDDSATAPAVALPQALHGAMLANPDVYATIPVHVAVTGAADTVTVTVAGVVTSAVEGDADWVADVPIATLGNDTYDLEAIAASGDQSASATASLTVSRTGTQVTTIAADGNAGTPRLLPTADHLYLTWTDSRDGTRTARLAELDGAGRFVKPPIALLHETSDVLYARTAISDDGGAIGVLFQESGGPYTNHFAIVDRDGAEVVAPIALDGTSYGSYGGDVAWDGSGFVLVWRVNDGAGHSEVRWMRVTPAGDVTGPVAVASPGNDDPHGGFDPITEVGVRVIAGASLVDFVRYEYDATLQLELPACQVTSVAADGTVGADHLAHAGWTWQHDCRLLDGDTLLWGEEDLNDPSDNPPTALRAATVAADGSPGTPSMVVSAPEHRGEPALAGGVLAWLDDRTYTDPQNGRIQLYVAPLVTPDPAAVFAHARFVEGTSELRVAAVASNRMLSWIDERHGGSVVNPQPELWIDTAWY